MQSPICAKDIEEQFARFQGNSTQVSITIYGTSSKCPSRLESCHANFSYMLSLSRRAVVNVLRFSWVLVVLWHEFVVFDWVLRDCRWPDSQRVCVLPRVVYRLLRMA